MVKQGYGSIVTVSSVFGLWPFALTTGYSAVKQAVVGLSLALRPEAADLGVNVSVACPGSIDTEVRKRYKICNGDRDKFNSFIYKQISPKKPQKRYSRAPPKTRGDRFSFLRPDLLVAIQDQPGIEFLVAEKDCPNVQKKHSLRRNTIMIIFPFHDHPTLYLP